MHIKQGEMRHYWLQRRDLFSSNSWTNGIKSSVTKSTCLQRTFSPPATVVAERLCFHRCLSVHRGVSATPHAGIHPRDQRHTPLGADTLSGADTPKDQTPVQQTPIPPPSDQRQTPPWNQTPPKQTPPQTKPLGTRHSPRAGTPRSACWEIRATSGRYAYLLPCIILLVVHGTQLRIQDFPVGVPTPNGSVQTYHFAKFLPKTAWKWKKLEQGGAPLLGSETGRYTMAMGRLDLILPKLHLTDLGRLLQILIF